jgi:metacaspase-1
MPKGIALTIGLNAVDPNHYGGWSGNLNACEADAEDMAAIARQQGFTVTTLMTKAATRSHVMEGIKHSALELKTGEIFMLSYSGHGGQVPDRSNDEPDDQDETWCLYDGQLIDDELYLLLGQFAVGVRILVFSDSCHSGTVAKMAYLTGTTAARASADEGGQIRYRAMPDNVALRTYRTNKPFYDGLQEGKTPKDSQPDPKASVLLISGCQDNQLSQDGAFNGLFTGQLLRVWKDGLFRGNYRTFHRSIVRRMPPDQTPNLYAVGASDPSFLRQKPFTI